MTLNKFNKILFDDDCLMEQILYYEYMFPFLLHFKQCNRNLENMNDLIWNGPKNKLMQNNILKNVTN